jgi:hypothetical protein
MMMIRKSTLGFGAIVLFAASQFGCDDTNKKPTLRADAASADQAPAINPKLRAALAIPSAPSAAASASGEGPPPGGIFAPGAADARHAKGAPVKIQMGSEGSEPRVSLAPQGFEAKGTAKVSVLVHTGPRTALPSVDLTLAFKTEKPKADNPADAAPLYLVQVQKAALSASQPGSLPAGADKEMAKLSGNGFRIATASGGGASDIALNAKKGAVPELERVLTGVADTLFASCVPAPPKPVGVGGSWIAESRGSYGGIDVITYRLYLVKNIENGRATLTVEMRQYAASGEMSFEGLPAGSAMQQYQSEGHGEFQLRVGEDIATQGELSKVEVMTVRVGGGVQQGQAPRIAPLQFETQTKMQRP